MHVEAHSVRSAQQLANPSLKLARIFAELFKLSLESDIDGGRALDNQQQTLDYRLAVTLKGNFETGVIFNLAVAIDAFCQLHGFQTAQSNYFLFKPE